MVNIPDVTAVQRLADVAAVREPTTLANEAALTGKPAGQYNLTATSETVAWNGSTVTARGPLPAKATDTAAAQAAATGLGNQLQPGTLNAVPSAAERAWMGDLQYRPYTGTDTPDGTIIRQDTAGRKFQVNFTGLAEVDWWKTVKTNGTEDCGPGITEAGAWAKKKGKSLRIPGGTDRRYLLTSAAVIPPGVQMTGEGWINENPGKSGETLPISGSVFLVRGNGQFKMGTGSGIEGIVALYDQQRYRLELDSSKPDGLQDFIDYPALFVSADNYGAPRIENILFLGGSRIFDVASGGNPEKVVLRNIRGAFTHTAVRMPWATDIPSISGLFMNANSLYRFIEQFGGPMPSGMTSWEYAKRMHTKTAKNTILLHLGRVDELHGDRIFCYAVRDYVRFEVLDSSMESALAGSANVGNGGGISLVNSAADVCFSTFYIGRNHMSFGIKTDNFWTTPLVRKPVYGSTALPVEASGTLLNMSGTDNAVQFNNTIMFGSPVEQVADSARATVAMVGTPGLSRIYLNNTEIRDLDGPLTDGNFKLGGFGDNKHAVYTSNTTLDLVPVITPTPPAPQLYSAMYSGTVPAVNGQILHTFHAPYNGTFTHATGRCVARTATDHIAEIELWVGGRKLGVFHWGANATVGDALYAQGLDPSFKKDDLIRAIVNGAGGLVDPYWEAPITPI